MRVTDLKTRRKRLIAVIIDPAPDKEYFGFEADNTTGMPLIDATLCAERAVDVGDVYTESELFELIDESFYRRAYSRAIWYLSRSDCSRKELFSKLVRAFPEETVARVCDRAEELGLIDDERYAARLAENYLTNKSIAARKAEMLMVGKGIDRESARTALDEIEVDNVATICSLIEKKYRSRMDDRAGVEKTAAALARRGFSFSDIREAIKKYNDEAELTED